MKFYELTYLASPDLSTEELKSFSQKVSSFIIEEKGEIEQEIEPFRKKLGYPIKKKIEAFLITLKFNLGPKELVNLEKKLKQEPNILRYILLAKKKPSAKELMPSIKKIKKEPSLEDRPKDKSKKVELKEIDEKIEEILKE